MKKKLKNPWVAALWSILITGNGGQIYNRQYKKAVVFFSLQTLFFILSKVSFREIFYISDIVTLYSIFDAYKIAKNTLYKKPNKNAVYILFIIVIIISVILAWYRVPYPI